MYISRRDAKPRQDRYACLLFGRASEDGKEGKEGKRKRWKQSESRKEGGREREKVVNGGMGKWVRREEKEREKKGQERTNGKGTLTLCSKWKSTGIANTQKQGDTRATLTSEQESS